MTFENLCKMIEENNIPKDVTLESDSGWECGPTDMEGVYYNRKTNTIVFTQYCYIEDNDKYYDNPEYEVLKGSKYIRYYYDKDGYTKSERGIL